MKIYCELCKKVQPVQIDNCIDVKTKKSYQDIVCAECNLVIASGTDIAQPEREWVGLTDQERADWHSMGLVGVEIVAAHLKEKNGGNKSG